MDHHCQHCYNQGHQLQASAVEQDVAAMLAMSKMLEPLLAINKESGLLLHTPIPVASYQVFGGGFWEYLGHLDLQVPTV